MSRSDAPAAETAAVSLWRLKTVVFLCGAVLMALEMAGVRVLNVYFGSTIYVWGAIIGVFLGALSLGYYLGGMVADRVPRFAALGGFILAAAVFVAAVPPLSRPVCEWLGEGDLDPRWQALFGSLILFFIPSVLMGTVSPFAVRLAAREVKDMGKVSGRLYALSTLGSIAGTFLAAFVLIELVGNQRLILGLAVTLAAAAALTFSRTAVSTAAVASAVLVAVLVHSATREALLSPKNLSIYVPDEMEDPVLEAFDSPYHHIIVAEGADLIDYTRTSRFLIFNKQIQSGIVIEGEGEEKIVSACGYADLLHLGMIFRDEIPKRVLVIGAGGGVIPMVFKQDYPGIERIDVVDIDPSVFDMARKHFRYPEEGEDPVIRSHLKDGRLFVTHAETRYDYIILDAYSSGGRVPFHLVTKEFFETVRDHLAPGGVMVMNVISALRGEKGQLFRAVNRTAREVFGSVYVFPRRHRSDKVENIISVCTLEDERLSKEDVLRRFHRKMGTVVHRERLRDIAPRMLAADPDVEDAPVLTDDFAPVDSMIVD